MRTSALVLILLLVPPVAAAAPVRGAAIPAADDTAADARRGSGARGIDDTEPADDDVELAGARAPVRGPSVSALLTAAYAAAGLDHNPGGGWIRRARLAGLVPWLTVRTARNTSWQDAHSEVGHGTSLEVRATWRLDRLVFDSRELQVTAIESARRRERRRLSARVIRCYFTWRRAEGIAAGSGDNRVTARAGEAAAELDALTDGWFSEELARLGAERPGRDRGGMTR